MKAAAMDTAAGGPAMRDDLGHENAVPAACAEPRQRNEQREGRAAARLRPGHDQRARNGHQQPELSQLAMIALV